VVDLIPVHPLGSASLDEASKIARDIAERLSLHGVATFLYGSADELQRPLVQRRKELGWFRSKLTQPGGWTAVGATPYVLNCNVKIETNDMTVGRQIAKAVRQPNFVEVMALPHGERIEIACNLNAPEAVTPEEVILRIRQNARALQCSTSDDHTVIGFREDELLRRAVERLYAK